MSTLENIQAKIARLQAEAEAIVKKQALTVVAKIMGLMKKQGLTLADLESHIGGRRRGRQAAGVKAADKRNGAAEYIDPKSGATWTGNGRVPAWIANAKNRSRFLIDVNVQSQASAAGSASKAGNDVRGPQAPKYIDPETGATWRGRGRAPAWLADAKDRIAFLIERKGGATSKRTTARKSVAKKMAVRKVGPKKAVVGAVAAKKRAATVKKSTVEEVTSKKAEPKVVGKAAARAEASN